jgi:hypothetical protein
VEALYKPDAQRRAVMSVVKSKSRANLAMTQPELVTAVAQARQLLMDKKVQEWGSSWRPQPWLTWIVAGVPCAENGGTVMDTLAIARQGTDVPTTDSLASRQQRRAARR